jgi:hypothetical protein
MVKKLVLLPLPVTPSVVTMPVIFRFQIKDAIKAARIEATKAYSMLRSRRRANEDSALMRDWNERDAHVGAE